jgi:hypothetical protein
MYPTTHFGVSAPIVLASFAISPNFTGLAVGGVLGFASHYPTDYLNESFLGNYWEKEYIKWDALLLAIAFMFGVIYGYVLGGFIGVLKLTALLIYAFACGLGMDYIDKKFGLSVKYPEKYPATFYFHKQKKFIQCNLKWTKIAQIIGMISVILSIIFIK